MSSAKVTSCCADILERISDAFLSVDREWRIRYLNARAEQLLSKTRSELIGRNLWDAFPEAVDSVLYNQLRDAVEEDVEVTFEAHYEPSARWAQVRAYPDSEGLCIHFQDITRRKEAEETLQRYQLLSRYARDIILFVRADGRILEANDAAVRAYGYPVEELCALTIWDLRAPETHDVAQAQMMRADGPGILFETVHRRRDGSTFPVEVSSQGTEIHGERVLLSIIRDITERKQSEEALRESEERLRVISSATFEGIAIHDGSRIIEANDAIADMFGYQHDELLDSDPLALIAPEFREVTRKHITEAYAEAYEVMALRKDGSRFPAEFRGRRITYRGRIARAAAVRDVTERVQAEEALRERERDYRTLAENSPEVIARFDRHLRHTYVNEYGAKVYGVPKDEVIGKTNADLGMPADKVAFWTEHFEEVLATGRQQTVDFDFESPNFGRQYFSSLFVPEFNEKGEVESILAITRDVTPLKEAERALEAERARLQIVLTTLPVGVFIADASGRILLINDAGKQVWGANLPPTEHISDYAKYKGWWPDTGQQLRAEDWSMARTLSKGEAVVNEVIDIERFDGTRGTILNSAAPIRDEQGRIVGGVVTAQDVTDLRIAQEELRRSRDLLQSVIDNTPAAIYVKDTNGRIILANKALAAVLGKAKEEIVGRTTYDFYPYNVAEAHTENDREIMSKGEPVTFEEIVPEDGTVRTFLSIKFPLKDEQGQVYGVGGVSSEITERVRAAEKVRKALERESYFSLQLQRALLPPAPTIGEGYCVAHTYVSPFAGREIGGDFYDVFPTEAGKVAIMIGDVSGKGLEAASVAANTRSTVRAFAYELSSAGAALTHANSVVSAQQSDGGISFFVTVFLAILDLPTGEISYSSAGHPPPAVFHSSTRSVELPEQGNPPLGILPRYMFEEGTAVLYPGDRIVLYTDGLSEARSDNVMFEVEGIERVLREHGSESAAEIVGALMSAATDWARGRLRDDTAIVVVERL